MSKTIVAMMIDQPADWEYGPILAAARAFFGLQTAIAAIEATPLTSMGGVTLQPQHRLSELDPLAADLWVLPGSPLWEQAPAPAPILAAIKARVAAGRPVAGICGATRALAQAGLLDDRAHTSNEPGYLDDVPGYGGKASYRDGSCISDGLVVSASGSAPISFAQACLRILVPEQEDAIRQYRAMFAREFA
ncbi:DJ-1/PfpI family protein [Lysobacter sp. 22409]|uniref:DJ-1/PfpI family protein n=1 Tax=Lysobacter sp. 22409 TaxID=3453917 RepID=UPI003F82EF5D